MQTIHLKKFGTVLVSHPAGLEAFRAIRPTLDATTPVQIDFAGVLTITPSWFDEFLMNLAEYMHGRVELLPTDNASVQAILPILSTARQDATTSIIKRAMAATHLSKSPPERGLDPQPMNRLKKSYPDAKPRQP